MQHIEHLPHRLNTAKKECRAIIETPKGRRNKFKYDPESCLFTLSRVLPEGFTFPFDFGFIPSTLAEDGDALDAVVLMDEPAHVGCLLTVRLIGAILVEQTENGKKTQNHRLVSVPLKTFDYRDVHTLDDLNGPLVEQLTEFLALYNKNSGKQDEILGVEGAERAVQMVQDSSERFRKKNDKGD